MTALAAACILAIVACMGPCLYRMLKGQTALDRLLAFDLSGVLVALAVALYGIVAESWLYMEISMGLAVLALVATISAAHYIRRRRIF